LASIEFPFVAPVTIPSSRKLPALDVPYLIRRYTTVWYTRPIENGKELRKKEMQIGAGGERRLG
jgi:hypothetical protein